MPRDLLIGTTIQRRSVLVAVTAIWWLLGLASLVSGLTGAGFTLLALGIPATILAYRGCTLEVVANETGLTVRNIYNSRHLRWDQIEGFRIGGSTSGGPTESMIYVLLSGQPMLPLEVTRRRHMTAQDPGGLNSRVKSLEEWTPGSE